MVSGNGLSTNGSGQTIPLWLNGQEKTTLKTVDVVSPLTGKVVHQAATADEEDADAAVAAAEAALPAWSKTKPSFRRDLFLKAADEFARRREEFREISLRETASADGFFAFDFEGTLEGIKTCAGLIASASQGQVPQLRDEGRSGMVVAEPYGVVTAIAPWNAPLVLGMRSFVGPLAMGNTVVLKGPERAPACYWALADVFHKVGLPAGCLQTITCRPEDAAQVTTALIAAPAVKKINFTGSTAIGSVIASLAGKHLKPVLMELGGKAPAIVCEDANLELAALDCTLGAFLNAGQICMSTERIIVNRAIADDFREILKATIDKVWSDEDGLVLIDRAPVGKNKQLLQDAIDKGAKAIYGDIDDTRQLANAMRPVVIEGTQKGMDLYYTESFGPTVSLIVVESDEEAIQIANDTDYGLSSSVFTSSLQRGLKIAKQIETGAVHINQMSPHDEASLPHGGAKKSGFGRFNGAEGLREWVRWKNITWND